MCLQSGAGYVCTPYSHLPPQSSEGAARHQNLPEPVFLIYRSENAVKLVPCCSQIRKQHDENLRLKHNSFFEVNLNVTPLMINRCKLHFLYCLDSSLFET